MAAAKSPFIIIDGDKNLNIKPPAIVMLQPKFVVNVATMIRNCASFGIEWLVLTGDRLDIPTGRKGDRMPRQERLRDFRTVKVIHSDFPMVLFRDDVAPIGVELTPSSMPLPYLKHPDNAVYLFGPEDGSIPAGWRAICHQIVSIPSLHCLNVATAGGIILSHRVEQRWRDGEGELLTLAESRG